MIAATPPIAEPVRFRPDAAFIGVTTLFFAWGFVAATIDVLVPSVRSVFDLSYTEAMLTQFAFFIAYGLVSLPAGRLVARIGYANANVCGLLAMVAGCLLIPVATLVERYSLVLVALFIMAAGTTLLQVAANPLVAKLGEPQRAHTRLNLSQAFNSAGTLVAPLVGSVLILRGGVFASDVRSNPTARVETLRSIDGQFLLMAAVLILLMAIMWRLRSRIHAMTTLPSAAAGDSPRAAFASPWALAGALAIFLYVGAEVATASVMINFLTTPDVLGVSAEQAGRLLTLYWCGSMMGRFIGSAVMARINAGRVLGVSALVASVLCLVVSQSSGHVAAIVALSIGCFNSIMFPTIFTLTLQRSSASATSTSGLLCMAIVGGAVLPPLCGLTADAASIHVAFLIPAVAYLYVSGFGLVAWMSRHPD